MELLGSLLHASMWVLMLLCGYVNLNDPDPHIWVTLYWLVAFLNLYALLSSHVFTSHKIANKVAFLLCGTAGMGSVFLLCFSLLKLYANNEIPTSAWEFFETEEGREVGGLACVFFDLAFIVSTLTEGKDNLLRLMYVLGIAVVISAVFGIIVQPELNKRRHVDHCSGSL